MAGPRYCDEHGDESPTGTHRKCGRCQKILPLEKFYKSKKPPYYHISYCFSCKARYMKENYGALTPGWMP